ncbi:MAG: tetratricopeptide repeat protein [Candidatus Hermodarchaeota archaeon]
MIDKLDQLLNLGENEKVLEILFRKDSLSLEERIFKARALEMRFDEFVLQAEEIINEVIQQIVPLNDKILELKARSAKLNILIKFMNFKLLQQELDAWVHLWEQCTAYEKQTLRKAYATYLAIKSFSEAARSTDIEVFKSASQDISLTIEIFESLNDYYSASWALFIKALIDAAYGNIDAYQEMLSRVIKLSQTINNVFTSHELIKLHKGTVQIHEGKSDQALKTYEEVYIDALEHFPPWLYSWYFGGHGLGLLYLLLGQYPKVIESIPKIMRTNEKLKAVHQLAWDKRILGEAYVQMGEISKGKGLIEEALEINREINDSTCLVQCLVKVCKLNYFLGDTEKAIDNLREAIGLLPKEKQISNLDILWFLEGYYFFTILLLEQGMRAEAEKFFHTLTQRYQKHSSKIMDFYFSLGEILLLKYEKRAVKKVMAQTKLEQLLKTTPEGWLSQEIYFYAVIHYLDLLLHEFNEFQEQEVLEEILKILDETKRFAHKYYQTNFLVQFSVIEAKLLLIQGKLQEANELLENLAQQAEVVNIPRLKKQVEKELLAIENTFSLWKKLITDNVSLREKIEQSELISYIKSVRKVVELYYSERA